MTYDQIKSKIPEALYPSLVEAMTKYEINTIFRVAHFVSQAAHESGDFKHLVENLNYSAEGLRRTFPKYFPTLDIATQYARKPEKIASRTYANRMGNGDEASKEGFKFRGRGIFQLTGKDNYKAFGAAAGIDLVEKPELVAEPKHATLSACWYFSRNGLNQIADEGIADEVIVKITKKINGGTHGLDDRRKRFTEVYALMFT